MSPAPLLIVLLALIAIPVGIIAVIYLFVPAFKGIAWLFKQVRRARHDLQALLATQLHQRRLVHADDGRVVAAGRMEYAPRRYPPMAVVIQIDVAASVRANALQDVGGIREQQLLASADVYVIQQS